MSTSAILRIEERALKQIKIEKAINVGIRLSRSQVPFSKGCMEVKLANGFKGAKLSRTINSRIISIGFLMEQGFINQQTVLC